MKLKELRKSTGMTQKELAHQMDLSRSTIAMWETSKASPRCEMIPKLAKVLRCSISDLFDSENETGEVSK